MPNISRRHGLFRAPAILLMAVAAVFVYGALAQPFRLVPAKDPPRDPNAVLVASGTIAFVDRRNSRLFLQPTKPFWGPLRTGSDTIVRWPTEVQLSVWLAAGTPMTINGKKAHFEDLAAGQPATVYYILRFVNGGVLSTIEPFAQRIDVVVRPSKKKT